MGMLNPHKRRAPAKVPSHWFALYRNRGNDLRFWCIVAHKVRERRVRHTDAAGVRTICAEVDGMLSRMKARGEHGDHQEGRRP
jgi:hypothetical protein